MNPALATEVDLLSSMGWKVTSQTESTAALETRGPFSWWIFLFCLLLFPIIGATLYILWWMIFDNHNVFLRAQVDQVTTSGDVWLIERQKANIVAMQAFQREVKTKGFFAAALPSLIALLVAILIWFIMVWVFIQIVD